MRNALILPVIVIVLFGLYRLLRSYWLRRLVEKKQKAKRIQKRAVNNQRTSKIASIAVRERVSKKQVLSNRDMLIAWVSENGGVGARSGY